MATITQLAFKISSAYDGSAITRAKADIESLSASIDNLSRKSASVSIDVNTQGLEKARADLAALGAMSENVKIDVDTADAEAKLAVLRADADETSRSMDNMGSSATSSSERIGSLAVAALSLGPALAPIAVAAIGGAVAFGTMAVAGLSAAGVFGGAVLAAFRGTSAASKTMQADLAGVKTSFASWGSSIASTVAGPVDTALTAMSGSFQKLTPLVAAVAPVAERVANAFAAWTRSNLQGWVSWLSSVGVPILNNFVTAGQKLGTMFGDALKAFAPLAVQMSAFIAKLASEGATWASGGGFDRFVALVRAYAPQVEAIFRDLGTFVGNVGKAMASMGPAALGLAGALAKLMASLSPGQLQAIASLWLAWKAPLLWLFEYVPGLAAAFAKLVGAIPPSVLQAIAIAMVAIKTAEIAWAVIQAVLDAELLAFPLTWIILAVVAVVAAIVLLATHWTQVWQAVQAVAQTVWGWLQSAWQAVWGAIQAVAQAIWGWLQSTWQTIWGGIQTVAQAVWSWLQSTWQTIWGGIQSVAQSVWGWLQSTWQSIWGAIQTVAQSVWGWLQSTWDTITNAIESAWQTVSGAVSKAWDIFWNDDVKGVVDPIWSWIKSTWDSITSAVKKAWDDVSGPLKTAWHDVWTTMKSTAQTIWDDIKTVVATPINFLIGCWDVIADVIGVGHVNPIPNEPGYFTLAEGGQVDGQHVGPGLVKGPGSKTADRVPGWLSNQEFVMNADATQRIGVNNLAAMNAGAGLESFALAAGGAINRAAGFRLAGGDTGPGQTANTVQGNAPGGAQTTQAAAQNAYSQQNSIIAQQEAQDGSFWHQLVGGFEAIVATAVYDLMKPVLDGVVAAVPSPFLPGLSTDGVGGWPKKAAQKLEDGILSKLKSAEDAAKQAAAAIGGTIPDGQKKALIDSALQADGIPASQWPEWEAGLNTLITRESNWDAGAINNYDSNAAAGTPSEGLAQVIAPTFAAYRNPSLPDNLLNPEANIAAAINYINAVYGGIGNVQQANANLPAKGYWTGTGSAVSGWHKVGENGPEWVKFRGGETVTDSAPGGNYTVEVHHHWPAGVSKETVKFADDTLKGDEVVRALKAGVGKRPH